MNEEISLFQSAGLTEGEAKVYSTSLKLGLSSVGNIAKEGHVSLSKIYEILNNLIKKGLVSSIKKNNVSFFTAADPERILEYVEGKKQQIEKTEDKIKSLIPFLKKEKEGLIQKDVATLYEEYRGIQSFYEYLLDTLNKGDIIYALGIPKYAAERYEGYFLDWNKRRSEKGISIKVLYNHDAHELAQKRIEIPLTDVKFLTKDMTTPSWILIAKDFVATIHLTKKPICLVIRDFEVAKSYLNFFELLWKMAK